MLVELGLNLLPKLHDCLILSFCLYQEQKALVWGLVHFQVTGKPVKKTLSEI